MKNRYLTLRLLFVFGLLAVTGACFFSTRALAGQQRTGVAGAEVRIVGDLKAGQPVKAEFDLKGYQIPRGSYASINVKYLQRPDGNMPWIVTGYPETTMTFHTPGKYRLLILLNEVSKPSCGGVNAKTLLEKEVELDIE